VRAGFSPYIGQFTVFASFGAGGGFCGMKVAFGLWTSAGRFSSS
jgi:hypothetical protein